MELGSKFIKPRCPQSPGWSHEKTSGLHVLGCKSRKCRICGQYWAWKWQQALKEVAEYNDALGYPPVTLALTLTFAQQLDYKTVQLVLNYFWELCRKDFPALEYWGVVEYNQAHTLPHLHFVLAGYDFIDKDFVKPLWIKAQKWAKIDHLAYITRIEKIRGEIQRYFTKYITKLTGGKDEIPRREQWQGRYVRYSKHFFPASIPTMAIYASWKRQFDLDLFQYKHQAFSVHNDRATLAGLSGFIEKAEQTDLDLESWLNRPWEPEKDWIRGKPVKTSLFDLSWYNIN